MLLQLESTLRDSFFIKDRWFCFSLLFILLTYNYGKKKSKVFEESSIPEYQHTSVAEMRSNSLCRNLRKVTFTV